MGDMSSDNSISRGVLHFARTVTLSACLCAPVFAQMPATYVPRELEGVGIEQKLGGQVDTALRFRDENGNDVKLGDFLSGDKPALLTLNYYRCPGLCNIQLNGLLDTLKAMQWSAGDQFRIITVSFDPMEGPDTARAKKGTYLSDYDRPTTAAGWRFLTGPADSIKTLAASVGFKYRWNDEQQQWAHDAALIVLSPNGKISRYFGGVMYEPEVVRLSLVEAGEGKVGSLWDRIFLNCFHYDPKIGKYRAAATMIMQLGGAVTVIVLGASLIVLWVKDQERRRAALAAEAHAAPSGA